MKKNIYKLLFSLSITLFLTSITQAQSITPQSINSGGTKMSQSNGSLSFVIGELVVLGQKDSQGNTLGNGFIAGATTTEVNGCAGTKNITINVNNLPITDINNNSTTICSGQPITLTASGATTETLVGLVEIK